MKSWSQPWRGSIRRVRPDPARKPEGVSWGGLWSMFILCGIGFTMGLFIGSLAFEAGADDYVTRAGSASSPVPWSRRWWATSRYARCCRGTRPPSPALDPSSTSHPLEGST